MTSAPSDVLMLPFIYVSLLPFEKTLLENVARADDSIANRVNEPGNPSAITKLFERWGWAVSVGGAFADLEQDLSDAKEKETSTSNPSPDFVPSPRQRENCYHAFLGTLSYPQLTNKCRADNFDKENESFRESLLLSRDIFRFLRSAPQHVRMSDSDSEHWKIMGAMMLRFPDEMERWTANRRLSFELLASEARFEIWQVVRMYLNHLVGPSAGKSLLGMWGTPPHMSLQLKIWEEKQAEYKRSQAGLNRLLQEIRGLESSEFDGDENSIDDSTGSVDERGDIEDNENRAEEAFDGALSDQYKEEFLSKALAFGHLGLFLHSTTNGFKSMSIDDLENIMGNRKAERWLLHLLRTRKQTSDDEILLMTLPGNSINDAFHRLFFSETKIFQHYCETQSLPVLNIQDNARIAIVTRLPGKLLELEPKNFWKKWASTPANLNDCSLMLKDDTFMLVQSPLGWLFRNISSELSESAACQFLLRCTGDDYGSKLREALGDEYRVEHEAFLDFIPADQLSSMEFLDNGGNGDVWKATWSRPESFEWGRATSIQVALKRIPQGNLSRQAALKKFVREMQLAYMALGGNPSGCIEFYGISLVSTDTAPQAELYLVFELASEGSIWKYMEREGVCPDWQDIIDIFSNIAFGLWDGLHIKHIAHGDLHENNVLVTKRQYSADAQTPEANRPILIDFGRGSLWSSLVNQDSNDDIPESDAIKVAERLDLHTTVEDVQAYGALIWELTLRWMKLTDHKTIPRPLVKVIADCLSPDPDDRPSMIEVVRSLEASGNGAWGKTRKGKTDLEISRKEAKALLNPLLASSLDRPKPSAPSYRQPVSFSYPTIEGCYLSDEEE